jgi:hypothetical protein
VSVRSGVCAHRRWPRTVRLQGCSGSAGQLWERPVVRCRSYMPSFGQLWERPATRPLHLCGVVSLASMLVVTCNPMGSCGSARSLRSSWLRLISLAFSRPFPCRTRPLAAPAHCDATRACSRGLLRPLAALSRPLLVPAPCPLLPAETPTRVRSWRLRGQWLAEHCDPLLSSLSHCTCVALPYSPILPLVAALCGLL